MSFLRLDVTKSEPESERDALEAAYLEVMFQMFLAIDTHASKDRLLDLMDEQERALGRLGPMTVEEGMALWSRARRAYWQSQHGTPGVQRVG